MAAKKVTRAKAAKTPGAKRAIGLTSAIGPKATTVAVIVVLGAGTMLGVYQRSAAAKAKSTPIEAGPEMTPDPPSTSKTPVIAKAHTPSAVSGAPASAATAATAPASPKAPVTTIVGCLEKNGESFRLKNTSGDDAPKSRSWKSGFIKKGTATVTVVDPTDSFGLPNRIGQRVSVTGSLVDRELQARSVRRVASTCN